MNIIKDNKTYLAISDMLLVTTMLSNEFNDKLNEDASKIIRFIGNVFDLQKQEINECINLILNDLTSLSTTKDVKAFNGNRGVNDFTLIADFAYLKSEAILKIQKINTWLEMTNRNGSCFDYGYLRKYFPVIRYEELKSCSFNGNVDVNRTVAILQSIGIGCTKDIDKAIYRFKECAYWGDITSLYYLSYLYSLKNDKKSSKLYSSLSKLNKFILEGRTILPHDVQEKYNEKTLEEFKIISSIFQDIVLYFKMFEINQSFLEVVLSEDNNYSKRMLYINEFRDEEWKKNTSIENEKSKENVGSFFSRRSL